MGAGVGGGGWEWGGSSSRPHDVVVRLSHLSQVHSAGLQLLYGVFGHRHVALGITGGIALQEVDTTCVNTTSINTSCVNTTCINTTCEELHRKVFMRRSYRNIMWRNDP